MIDRPLLPTQLPEWQRCGRFFLIAIGLHAALLFYPLHQVLTERAPPETSGVRVNLVKPAAPAQVTTPHETPKPIPQLPPQPRQSAQSKSTPVIATAPAAVTPPATVPSLSVPSTTPAAPVPASNPAPISITAARYDVAYLNNPHPEYPPISRRMGEEGKVLLRVRVNSEGRAATVELEKSSNFDRLDEAAKRSVTRWRFVPAKRGDESVEATVIVPIIFRLDN